MTYGRGWFVVLSLILYDVFDYGLHLVQLIRGYFISEENMDVITEVADLPVVPVGIAFPAVHHGLVGLGRFESTFSNQADDFIGAGDDFRMFVRFMAESSMHVIGIEWNRPVVLKGASAPLAWQACGGCRLVQR